MKSVSFVLALIALITVLFAASVSCSDDDEDDNSASAPDDDDDDDDDDSADDDDDDDTSDDDDDDDTIDDDDDDDGKIIYDDGSPESGMSAICAGCVIAQGFTPPAYPAFIQAVDYYIHTDDGFENELRLNLYYSYSKADQPPEAVYYTLPFTADNHDGWNAIDLTDVQTLQGLPVTEGKLWVGFEFLVENGDGPWIGWDYQGDPDDDIWYYDLPEPAWIHLYEAGYYGALMIRPTLTW